MIQGAKARDLQNSQSCPESQHMYSTDRVWNQAGSSFFNTKGLMQNTQVFVIKQRLIPMKNNNKVNWTERIQMDGQEL